MRLIVASLLVIVAFAPHTAAFQGRGDAVAGKSAIRACSLLPKELVMKVSGAVNKLVFDLPPQEEPIGKSGSACDYADITLQIDAFTPQRIEEIGKTNGKEWVPVSGVGDRAYFRNNKDRFAELIGSVGAHTFTIQMGVPFQGTAEGMKPNVIALANAIVPKLR
jgi:hypothetical protein